MSPLVLQPRSDARQCVPTVTKSNEVLDNRGDEDRLAGTAEAGNGKPDALLIQCRSYRTRRAARDTTSSRPRALANTTRHHRNTQIISHAYLDHRQKESCATPQHFECGSPRCSGLIGLALSGVDFRAWNRLHGAIMCRPREEHMPTTGLDDPVLIRFASGAVRGLWRANRTCGPVGFPRRGDSRRDSDYDIAVFFRQPGEFWDDFGRPHITQPPRPPLWPSA